MIEIINTDKHPRETGEHEYTVYISKREICKFTHCKEYGLAQCLSAAANAVKLIEENEFYERIAKKMNKE